MWGFLKGSDGGWVMEDVLCAYVFVEIAVAGAGAVAVAGAGAAPTALII